MTTKGKKPISKKKKISSTVNYDDIFGSQLKIPPNVQADADKRGLTLRWLNSSEVAKNQGYHPKSWKVYKVESGTIGDEFGRGNSPTKEIRRGDLILGYKEAEEAQAHKEFLRHRAERYSQNNKMAQQAAQLRKAAGGSNVKVDVGLNDNDE